MNIDFTKIVIREIDGNEVTVDIAKELGAILYKSAIKKSGLDLGRQLYNEGSIDVDKDTAAAIKQLLEGNFLAVIQEGLEPVLDKIINADDTPEVGVEEIKDEQPTE